MPEDDLSDLLGFQGKKVHLFVEVACVTNSSQGRCNYFSS